MFKDGCISNTFINNSFIQLLVYYFIFFGFFHVSQANSEINTSPLSAVARLKVKNIPQGANTELIIDLTLAKNHHAYKDQFKLSISSPPFIQLGEFTISPVISFNDKYSKTVREGIKDSATLRTPLGIPSVAPLGKINANIVLKYQACTNEYCLLPKNLDIPLSFEILSSTEEFGSVKKNKKETLEDQIKNLGLLSVFVLVFIAGILTSFTPCVFPMIPITVAVIGNRAHTRSKVQNFLASSSYVLGIAITYSALGLFAASTGSLFGSYLGHPIFVGVISTVFLLMGISMLGFFDLQIPNFISQPLSRLNTGNGYFGAFFSGIIAGIVASPCVGPILVSILTYVAQTGNLLLGFWLLFTYAIGLGMLFLVLGTSSSLLNKLPKSGQWMNRVKIVFGILMIGIAIYFAYPLIQRNSLFSNQNIEIKNKLNFLKYSDHHVKTAVSENRPIIIDFWADWCAACKQLERETFSDSKVMELSRKFTLLKFDATNIPPEFEKLKNKYKIIGLPHLVFYDSKGRWREDLTLTGFEKADKFHLRMDKALKSDK